MDLLIVLTARCGSQRLKDKAVVDIHGTPLVEWIARRYMGIGDLVLATTKNKEDDVLEDIGKSLDIPVCRHSPPNDVIGRITKAKDTFYPKSKFVFRALGDCPFYATELLQRAVFVMSKFSAEAFAWMLPPENLPVYGAREFPYSIKAWTRIDAQSKIREHVDHYYIIHRGSFSVVYHEAPDNAYFRPTTYRLEVDYPEDVEFVREVAQGVGMLASLPDVIHFLDENPAVVNINSHCQEKTGPLVSYTHKQRRGWFSLMRGKPILDWDGTLWKPPDKRATPIFCSAGKCMIGYGYQGWLHINGGTSVCGPARVTCACGAGRVWHRPH